MSFASCQGLNDSQNDITCNTLECTTGTFTTLNVSNLNVNNSTSGSLNISQTDSIVISTNLGVNGSDEVIVPIPSSQLGTLVGNNYKSGSADSDFVNLSGSLTSAFSFYVLYNNILNEVLSFSNEGFFIYNNNYTYPPTPALNNSLCFFSQIGGNGTCKIASGGDGLLQYYSTTGNNLILALWTQNYTGIKINETSINLYADSGSGNGSGSVNITGTTNLNGTTNINGSTNINENCTINNSSSLTFAGTSSSMVLNYTGFNCNTCNSILSGGSLVLTNGCNIDMDGATEESDTSPTMTINSYTVKMNNVLVQNSNAVQPTIQSHIGWYELITLQTPINVSASTNITVLSITLDRGTYLINSIIQVFCNPNSSFQGYNAYLYNGSNVVYTLPFVLPTAMNITSSGFLFNIPINTTLFVSDTNAISIQLQLIGSPNAIITANSSSMTATRIA